MFRKFYRLGYSVAKQIFISVIFVSMLQEANAAVVVFDDKGDFLSSTGATSATGPLPNLGLVSSPVNLGDLILTAGPPATNTVFVGASGLSSVSDWTTRLPGNDIAFGFENLNLDLPSASFSFGFDFVEPQNDPNVFAPFVDSTFTVTLKDSGAFVDEFTFNAPNDTAAFVGVFSDIAFDRVEIRETIGAAENEFFGEFFVGNTAPTNSVPEPSSIIGLGGLTIFGFVTGLKRKLAKTKKK